MERPAAQKGDHVENIRTRPLVWIPGPVAAGLGWAAHMAGGGQSPAILIVVALAALLGLGATVLGRRRLPLWAVLVAAGLAQQLLHLAFSAFASPDGFVLPGHGHGETPAPDAVAGPPAGSQDLHLMLDLHAAAALLTALVAMQGNRLVRWGRSLRWRAPASSARGDGQASGRERAADDADA